MDYTARHAIDQKTSRVKGFIPKPNLAWRSELEALLFLLCGGVFVQLTHFVDKHEDERLYA